MPMGTWLPSSAKHLFNRPIRALLPQINREPININVDEESHDALKAQQDKDLKGNGTCKDTLSFPVGSTVTVQWEDGVPWMHGVFVDANGTDHNGWSYIVRATEMDRLITHITRHIWKILIMVKQYL